jgi:hypothetical protein
MQAKQEPRPYTPEAERFDMLAKVIQHYERRMWPLDLDAQK